MVRFLEYIMNEAHAVPFRIDDGEATLQHAFISATGRDKDRCAVTKDLSLSSVSAL